MMHVPASAAANVCPSPFVFLQRALAAGVWVSQCVSRIQGTRLRRRAPPLLVGLAIEGTAVPCRAAAEFPKWTSLLPGLGVSLLAQGRKAPSSLDKTRRDATQPITHGVLIMAVRGTFRIAMQCTYGVACQNAQTHMGC